TSPSPWRVRQHFRNASWAASWASSWLPSRKKSVLTSSARTALKARTKSSPEVVAPFKVFARAEVLTASTLLPSVILDDSLRGPDWDLWCYQPSDAGIGTEPVEFTASGPGRTRSPAQHGGRAQKSPRSRRPWAVLLKLPE